MFRNGTSRKVRTAVMQGTGRKLRIEISGVYILYSDLIGAYSHAGYKTNSELTEFESNRNE